jgi:DNA-binding FadR family transcriptional regulator
MAPNANGGSAADEIADRLREVILGYEGTDLTWPIGSEDELIEQFGVSRPTLRQATRVLQQEQLVTTRRGIKGGLFGRRPAEDAVSHMASVFLRSDGATYFELISTNQVLGIACAERAARNPDEARRRSLLEHLLEVAPAETRAAIPLPDFQRITRDCNRRIADVAGNRALRLFAYVLMDLADLAPVLDQVYADLERRLYTFEQHEAIATTIGDGDPTAARDLVRRHTDRLLEWADETIRL